MGTGNSCISRIKEGNNVLNSSSGVLLLPQGFYSLTTTCFSFVSRAGSSLIMCPLLLPSSSPTVACFLPLPLQNSLLPCVLFYHHRLLHHHCILSSTTIIESSLAIHPLLSPQAPPPLLHAFLYCHHRILPCCVSSIAVGSTTIAACFLLWPPQNPLSPWVLHCHKLLYLYYLLLFCCHSRILPCHVSSSNTCSSHCKLFDFLYF